MQVSALLLLVALVGLLMVRDFSIWATFTIAGLGMGMILFMAASGMNLVFGLMGVMNFGHGIFMTLGAFVGALLLYPNLFMAFYEWAWVENKTLYALVDLVAGILALISAGFFADNMALSLLALIVVSILIVVPVVPFAWIFERLFIRPAGRSVLVQIMLTTVGMMIFSELCTGVIGRAVVMRPPPSFRGSWILGEVAIEKMRVLMIVFGFLVWLLLRWLLYRTRWGILVRATVENRELVETSGFRTRWLMMATFLLGAWLAGIGGLVWGAYQMSVAVDLGNRLLPLMFMVLVIGGLGSMTGTLLAAMMVGLITNYVAYAYPSLGVFSSVFLMMIVVLWRPDGLFPQGRN